jgi:branched-chain amino acid transport system permease protein
MLYHETGQFRTSYAADQAILPIRQDRIGLAIILVIAFGVVPLVSSDYWLSTIMLPFLIFSLAALGLNILTGYAGKQYLGIGAHRHRAHSHHPFFGR